MEWGEDDMVGESRDIIIVTLVFNKSVDAY